jgi:hypothetical protein
VARDQHEERDWKTFSWAKTRPYAARFRLLDLLSECPLWVDAVEKLSDTQRAGNNRIQFLDSLNQLRASLVS